MKDLIRAEWAKFRTVRAWVLAVIAAGLVIVAFGLLPGMQGTCREGECVLPTGPDGELVTEAFTFAHQILTGDGSITVRTTAFTGQVPADPTDPDARGTRPGLAPWAKAGLLVKAGAAPGSSYAAVMVTGGHGVRLQYDFLHDTAGPVASVSAESPVWLRLTRTGDAVLGEQSADGVTWTAVGTARLTGLPQSVEVGLFVTSPQYVETVRGAFALAGAAGGPTVASATFDRLDRQGSWAAGDWTAERIGGPDNGPDRAFPALQRAGDAVTITGSGDIAPAVQGSAGLGITVTATLIGTFAGLLLVVVVGALFITAEYRRGLIRTTFAAHPGRARVLAAKAVVLGAVTFVSGLVAAAITVPFGQKLLRAHGVYVAPVSIGTELRLIIGTAVLLALGAILALALGVLTRNGVAAVTTAVVITVLPYLLAMSVLPGPIGDLMLRISPASAFAIQQAAQRYPQVDALYTANEGYFPLPPWAGLAVLCAWTAVALAAAAAAVRRRDA